MDPNRVQGAQRQSGGKLREWWGRLIGRPEDEITGKIDRGVGKVQSGYGRLKDEVRAEERRQQEPPYPPGRAL
jgi:uncharacterized protein YjbJ (UPF0337 family)